MYVHYLAACLAMSLKLQLFSLTETTVLASFETHSGKLKIISPVDCSSFLPVTKIHGFTTDHNRLLLIFVLSLFSSTEEMFLSIFTL